MKHTTERARLLYLYGGDDGVRITCVRELESASNASQRTIREHLPTWRLQAQNMAENRLNSHSSLSLRPETLTNHANNVEFLSLELEKLKAKLRLLSPENEDYATIFRLYLSVEKQWRMGSGVQAVIDAGAYVIKAEAKAEAKASAAAKTEDEEESSEPLAVGFKRRG